MSSSRSDIKHIHAVDQEAAMLRDRRDRSKSTRKKIREMVAENSALVMLRRFKKSQSVKSQRLYVSQMRFHTPVNFDDQTIGIPWLTVWYSHKLDHIVAHCITQDAPKIGDTDARIAISHHPLERFFWRVQNEFEPQFLTGKRIKFNDLVVRFCKYFYDTRTAVIKEDLR